MEQVYIISKIDNQGRTEFLDYVFKDYTESRKTARKIIEKHNKNVIFQNLLNTSNESFSLLREVSPDCWISSTMKVTIEVLEVKVLMKKKKIKTRIVKETIDQFIDSEILM